MVEKAKYDNVLAICFSDKRKEQQLKNAADFFFQEYDKDIKKSQNENEKLFIIAHKYKYKDFLKWYNFIKKQEIETPENIKRYQEKKLKDLIFKGAFMKIKLYNQANILEIKCNNSAHMIYYNNIPKNCIGFSTGNSPIFIRKIFENLFTFFEQFNNIIVVLSEEAFFKLYSNIEEADRLFEEGEQN